MTAKLVKFKDWYEENEKKISFVSLAGGFILDLLTARIDSFLDNLWLALNIFSVAICIIVLNRKENFFLFNLMQFNFGAILGTSFVFYFRSAALSASWPFLLILLSALFANEFFKKHYEQLVFRVSFLYLSLFIYFSYLVPVLVHRIGSVVFLASGALSLIVLWGFVKVLKEFSRQTFFAVSSLFIVINLLYFLNVIPPIPLVLKDAGIYYSVDRTASGGYAVTAEKKSWLDLFGINQKIYWSEGKTLYAYSAVFSPADLNTDIVHEWQYKDENTGKWIAGSRIPLKLFGGRQEGFRTYSVKSALAPGRWRVNVTTSRGAVLGRISFLVIESPDIFNREVKVLK
ncbi:MAG: DUF2914 domain-containing protein [Candidatus Zambryskibacteria bacterium]|nr:DUF2914 domain-containing protein [Candidatus Zambryskibacteria bacterium]